MELQAKDLRIGNWIRAKSDKVKEPVCRLDGKINSCSIGYFEPIPLTEDYALRFRFKEEGRCFIRGSISLYFEYGIVKVYYATQYLSSVKIEYVHELQNFMYSFGEELTIKD